MSRLWILAFAWVAVSRTATGAPMTVRLHTSMPSPQPVGAVIGLMPHVENVAQGMLVYRYSISIDGGPSRVVRDFSQQREFVWSPPLYEHAARIHITVRNNQTKETADGD